MELNKVFTFDNIFKIFVAGSLLYIGFQLDALKKIAKTNENETNLVISKLDYVEADINSAKLCVPAAPQAPNSNAN